MRTLALLFLAVGGVNLLFASRRGAAHQWNVVMGVVGLFTGGVLAVMGDDGAPVLFAAVPALLLASFAHSRALKHAADEGDRLIEPPV